MNINEFSIAEFGSVVRRDTDEYSDNDLLIVTSNSPLFDKSLLEKYLVESKYSISFYNYEKLEFLSKVQNLFVLHLKTESNLIHDQSGRLAKILLNFHPKKSYLKEEIESMKYFDFLKYFPTNEIAQNCFLDCFFVGIRNYFVYKFANELNYNFSYKRMVLSLKRRNIITNQDSNTLLDLRKIKTGYRNNSTIRETEQFLIKVQNVLLKFGITHKLKTYNGDNQINSIYNQIEQDNISNYQKFRLLEICYKSTNQKIIYLENIFNNPQFYTPKIRSNVYLKHLKELIKTAHNKRSRLQDASCFKVVLTNEL